MCQNAFTMSAEDFNNSGNGFFDAGDYARAEACYRQAVAANPRFAPALNNLGSVLRVQKCYPEARRALLQALDADPALDFARFNLGRVAEDEGNTAEALLHYEKALALNSRFEKARVAIVQRQLLDGDRAGARTTVMQGLALSPANAGYCFYLGKVCHADNDIAAAENNYRQVLNIDPGHRDAQLELARLLEAQGKWRRAHTLYKMACLGDKAVEARAGYARVSKILADSLD
jgi:tetratricopeptide (TPR) repeat protein